MEYIEYINLGFERVDTGCTVSFKKTGHYEYYLKKVINDKISIELWGSELDKPKMIIKKDKDNSHIIDLTPEIVNDLLSSTIIENQYLNAC